MMEILEKRIEASKSTIVCSQREPSWKAMIMNDEVSANAIMKRATKHYIVVIQLSKTLNPGLRWVRLAGKRTSGRCSAQIALCLGDHLLRNRSLQPVQHKSHCEAWNGEGYRSLHLPYRRRTGRLFLLPEFSLAWPVRCSSGNRRGID